MKHSELVKVGISNNIGKILFRMKVMAALETAAVSLVTLGMLGFGAYFISQVISGNINLY